MRFEEWVEVYLVIDKSVVGWGVLPRRRIMILKRRVNVIFWMHWGIKKSDSTAQMAAFQTECRATCDKAGHPIMCHII